MTERVTRPAVGKEVRVRRADGRVVKGRIAWSKDGAWRLAGSGRLYYAPDDKIEWVRGEKKPSLWKRLGRALKLWG